MSLLGFIPDCPSNYRTNGTILPLANAEVTSEKLTRRPLEVEGNLGDAGGEVLGSLDPFRQDFVLCIVQEEPEPPSTVVALVTRTIWLAVRDNARPPILGHKEKAIVVRLEKVFEHRDEFFWWKAAW